MKKVGSWIPHVGWSHSSHGLGHRTPGERVRSDLQTPGAEWAPSVRLLSLSISVRRSRHPHLCLTGVRAGVLGLRSTSSSRRRLVPEWSSQVWSTHTARPPPGAREPSPAIIALHTFPPLVTDLVFHTPREGAQNNELLVPNSFVHLTPSPSPSAAHSSSVPLTPSS